MFSSGASMIARSMISKLTPMAEIGQIFTFTACAENVGYLTNSGVINGLYSQFIQIFPGNYITIRVGHPVQVALLYYFAIIFLMEYTIHQLLSSLN